MLYNVTCVNCKKPVRLERKDGLSHRVNCPECGKPNPLSVSVGVGCILGSGYRLDKPFGDLFLGYQEAIQRQVLVKVLPPATQVDEESVGRFLRETKLLAGLRHPGMLAAIDAGIDCGTYFLVTEYVPGVPLDEYLKRRGGKLAEKEACTLLINIAEALQYAWTEGKIVHRNVKPSNILITDDGKAMLMDLGIAKSVSESASNVTGSGFIVGTPEYMSPEQAQGMTIDFRTDLYSLGIVLYQCVTGNAPFRGDSPMEVLTQQVETPPVPARQLNHEVSEKGSSLLERMLQKEPDKRHANWDEALYALRFIALGSAAGAMPALPGGKVGAAAAPAAPATGPGSGTKPKNKAAQSADAAQRQVTEQLLKELKKPAPRGSLFMLYALAFIVPLCVAVLMFVMMKRLQPAAPPTQAKPGPAAVRASGTPEAPPPAAAPSPEASGDKSDAAKEMYDYATQFEKEHPGKFAEIVATYAKVRDQLTRTKYALMAENDIARVNQAQDNAKLEVLEQLKKQAQPLVDQQKFAAAAALYRDYAGSQAALTRRDRTQLADGVDAIARQAQASEKQKTEQLQLAITGLRDKLLAGLCANNPTLVAMLARQLPQDTAAGGTAELSALRALAERAGKVDATVAKSFETELTQTVKVHLQEGETVMVIKAVEGTVIAADKIIRTTAGSEGRLGTKFTPSALTVKDRIARLQRQSPEQGNLLCGLVALWSGDKSGAIAFFEADGSELGRLLLKQIAANH